MSHGGGAIPVTIPSPEGTTDLSITVSTAQRVCLF